MQKRWQTREVFIGPVGIGGKNPIRIQSMTSCDTNDVPTTVNQICRLVDGGCEIVRVTVQGRKEVAACEKIKNHLIRRGYTVPLVADIHFFPPAALDVADFVDKVRINPGNYADKRASFKKIEYTDKVYQEELNHIEDKFAPLVEKCKRLKRAIRIGTNHGSLSDRIMNRYGDTPEGMVESAFEFARICRKLQFHDIVFSMKSSHTQVMIASYRLLVRQMQELGWDYPLHLGVTEAGEGEEGRIKSAIGIGSLLLEGIGDTIRVSLTEDPWQEIKPCKQLIQFAAQQTETIGHCHINKKTLPSPFHRDGSVCLVVHSEDLKDPQLFKSLGCEMRLGLPQKGQGSVDGILTSQPNHPALNLIRQAGIEIWSLSPEITGVQFFKADTRRIKQGRAQLSNCPDGVILQFSYSGDPDAIIIQAAAEMGSLLSDGLAQGVCLDAPQLSLQQRRRIAFSILQGCRMRAVKTEFISCPSCGRTLFDLQTVAKGIREKTSHLPGVKIAIMGCIVNGPGEMADADFGYVGSKPGMIDLYVGKQRVERDVPMADAVDRLISLIKAHDRWIEPFKETPA